MDFIDIRYWALKWEYRLKMELIPAAIEGFKQAFKDAKSIVCFWRMQ